MTITELKKVLKSKKKSELEVIVLALYKHIPKKIITDEGIDKIFLLEDVIEPVNMDKIIAKEKQLIKEISTFIQNFMDGNYGFPNRIIPKAKRSKWRFEVMRFYKEIVSIFPTAVLKKEFADVFGQLYEAMCEGFNNNLVTTEDSFAAIRKNQVTFLHQAIQFKKEVYSGDALYRQVWSHVINEGLSEEIANDELYETLIVCFASPMDIEELIKVGKVHFSLAVEKYMETKKKDKYASTYDLHNMMEGLAILMLKIHDFESVKVLYYTNLKTFKNKEEMCFGLVKTLIHNSDGPGNDILNILNQAVTEGVSLRDSLAKLHKSLQKNVNCDLPNLY